MPTSALHLASYTGKPLPGGFFRLSCTADQKESSLFCSRSRLQAFLEYCFTRTFYSLKSRHGHPETRTTRNHGEAKLDVTMLFKRQSTDVENHTAHILCVADYKGWHDVRILSARKDDDNLTERLLKFKKKGPEFVRECQILRTSGGF